MKAARCAPALCGGKPHDFAAGTASHRFCRRHSQPPIEFSCRARQRDRKSPKQPRIRRMSGKLWVTIRATVKSVVLGGTGPGTSEMINQVERDNSRDTKIAARLTCT